MNNCHSKFPRRKCQASPNSKGDGISDELINHYLKEHDVRKIWDRSLSIPQAVFGDANPDLAKYPNPDKLSDKEWGTFLKNVKKDPHQARIPNDRLRIIAEHLANHWKRDSFCDFEDLYDYIQSLLAKPSSNPARLIQNPNALIIYDIALRLAHRFNTWPEKYVYLNGSGPYEAAKALGLGKFIKQRKILYEDIIRNYPELAALDAAQLEDFLCIFHNRLNNFKKKVII